MELQQGDHHDNTTHGRTEMKRQLVKLFCVGFIVLLLAGAFTPASDACTFIGYVGQPNNFQPTYYEEVRDYLLQPTIQNWDQPHYAGWSVTSYGSDPISFHCWRVSENADSLIVVNGQWSPYFHNANNTGFVDLAAAESPTVMIAHVRESRNQSTHPNPHPFLYENVFGKTWGFIHNGTVNTTALQYIMDAGFLALPVFHNKRYSGYWNDDAIDSEWLTMAYMKYLLVQNNYYFDDGGVPSNTPPTPTSSPEDWGICRVAQMMPIGNGTSGINGILTDGRTIWAVSKSNGGFPRTVYYEDHIAQGVTMIGSGLQQSGFFPLSHVTPGYILQSDGTAPRYSRHQMPSATLTDPQELRINARGLSAGDQWQPAISADPDSGSFVAVWVSNNVIVGRWYNQMGIAEGNQFTVSDSTWWKNKKSPSIAHSPDGQTITVVWLSASQPATPERSVWGCDRVQKRSFTWSDENRTWTPTPEGIRTVGTGYCIYYGSTDLVRHPSIAYADDGSYAISWERTACSPLTTQDQIFVKVYDSDGSVRIPAMGITPDGGDHEPDLAYLGSDINDYQYFAVSYHGLVTGNTYSRTVILQVRENGQFGTPVSLALDGAHTAVARLNDSQYFFVAYNDGNIRVTKCERQGLGVNIIETAIGQTVNADASPDIAVRGNNGTFYVTYDNLGPNGYDIWCARGLGTTLNREPNETNPEPLNKYLTSDQRYPAMAIVNGYPHTYNTGGPWYENQSNNDYFKDRRMILWQTLGQDTAATPNWGVAGQFRGIYNDYLAAWNINDNPSLTFTLLPEVIDESVTISDPVVYMCSDVTITASGSLTLAHGVEVYASPDCQLQVNGELIANYGCRFTPRHANTHWSGINVMGSAELVGCTIEGASIAINAYKPVELSVDDCMIQNNNMGIYIYAPAGSGDITIANSEITGSRTEGISMLSTPKATISACQLYSNGTDGILLTYSSPQINECRFSSNCYFGLNAFGSSPTLFCNNFEEDKKGEMLLIKGSYPILWKNNGIDGGSNTFLNTDHTLIQMLDSYPVCANGLNQFTIHGTGGYYMADLAGPSSKAHDVSGNAWYPTPPEITNFSPADPEVWKVDPLKSFGGCEAPKGTGNATQMLFEQGYIAEMAGNTAEAQAAYLQVISLYPDSSWAQVAASRLLENQLQAAGDLSELQTYYTTLQTSSPEDTVLVKTAADLATRTLVEQELYNPALDIYEGILLNPPTFIDSAYAVVDHAVTALRASYDATHNGLDELLPAVSIQTLQSLRQGLQRVIPSAPEAQHEEYLPEPNTVVLEQNYPNPFNAMTTVRYAVPSSGLVRLTIYNVVGQKVATLVDGFRDAGYHTISWEGTNLASGVYIYQLQANGQMITQKMLLLK